MAEHPATPQPATDDELAAFYLRARDVLCANCGYNRRDGTGAACPECQAQLNVHTGTPRAGAFLGPGLGKAIAIALLLVSLLITGLYASSTYDAIQYYANPVFPVPLVLGYHISAWVYATATALFIAALITQARLLAALTRGPPTPDRAGRLLAWSIGLMLVAALPETIFEIWTMIS